MPNDQDANRRPQGAVQRRNFRIGYRQPDGKTGYILGLTSDDHFRSRLRALMVQYPSRVWWVEACNGPFLVGEGVSSSDLHQETPMETSVHAPGFECVGKRASWRERHDYFFHVGFHAWEVAALKCFALGIVVGAVLSLVVATIW